MAAQQGQPSPSSNLLTSCLRGSCLPSGSPKLGEQCPGRGHVRGSKGGAGEAAAPKLEVWQKPASRWPHSQADPTSPPQGSSLALCLPTLGTQERDSVTPNWQQVRWKLQGRACSACGASGWVIAAGMGGHLCGAKAARGGSLMEVSTPGPVLPHTEGPTAIVGRAAQEAALCPLSLPAPHCPTLTSAWQSHLLLLTQGPGRAWQALGTHFRCPFPVSRAA